jgi:hypothetical protein
MKKAICCVIYCSALSGGLWSTPGLAQTACSYFFSSASCAPATTSSDSAVKSNAQKNASEQQVVVPQPSIFTQKNSSDDQSWNTQQKLYAPTRAAGVQQDTPSPQKSSTQQSGSQSGTNSRQVQSTLLDASSGNPASRIMDGNITNNGILKISTRNLTSTSPNSLAGGAANSMSNGSVLNSGNASSGSLSSAMSAKVRPKDFGDDQPAGAQKGGVPRLTARTTSTTSTTSRSKPAASKPKDATNCIFVGMQQVCG